MIPLRAGVVFPVGTEQLAELFDVARATPKKWAQRGSMPEPRWTIGHVYAWDLDEILTWAHATGRARRPGFEARAQAAIVRARESAPSAS